jgi:hypothetical protein
MSSVEGQCESCCQLLDFIVCDAQLIHTVFLSLFASTADLTKRIEAMEGLVGERDARIAVLESKLASVQAEISKSGT